jgi:hypothetical protein
MDPGLPGNIHRPLVNPGQLDLDQRNIALNKAFSDSKKQLYPRSGAMRNNVPITPTPIAHSSRAFMIQIKSRQVCAASFPS